MRRPDVCPRWRMDVGKLLLVAGLTLVAETVLPSPSYCIPPERKESVSAPNDASAKVPEVADFIYKQIKQLVDRPFLCEVVQFEESIIGSVDELDALEKTGRWPSDEGRQPLDVMSLESYRNFFDGKTGAPSKDANIVAAVADRLVNEGMSRLDSRNDLVAATMFAAAWKVYSSAGSSYQSAAVHARLLLALALTHSKHYQQSLEQLLQIAQNDLKHDACLETPLLWQTFELQAYCYSQLHNYSQAEQALHSAVTFKEKESRRCADLGDSLNRLGVALADQGRFQEAAKYFLRAIAERERLLAQYNPRLERFFTETGILRPALAEIFDNPHLSREERKTHKQELDNLGNLLSINPQNWQGVDKQTLLPFAQSVRNLGVCLQQMDELLAAGTITQLALHSYWQALGFEHPLTQRSDMESVMLSKSITKGSALPPGYFTLELLSSYLAESVDGRPIKADSKDRKKALLADCTTDVVYERRLKMYKKLLGASHPRVADLFEEIATQHCMYGEYKKSINEYNNALAIWEQNASNNRRLSSILNLVGLCNGLAGSYKEALIAATRALQIERSTARRDPRPVGITYLLLALLYEGCGDLANAKKCCEEGLAYLQSHQTVESISLQGGLYNRLHRLAIKLHDSGLEENMLKQVYRCELQQAIRTTEDAAEGDGADLVTIRGGKVQQYYCDSLSSTLAKLADFYISHGKLSAAISAEQQAVQMADKGYDANNERGQQRLRLAEMLRKEQKVKEAKLVLLPVAADYRKDIEHKGNDLIKILQQLSDLESLDNNAAKSAAYNHETKAISQKLDSQKNTKANAHQ